MLIGYIIIDIIKQKVVRTEHSLSYFLQHCVIIYFINEMSVFIFITEDTIKYKNLQDTAYNLYMYNGLSPYKQSFVWWNKQCDTEIC